MYSKIKSISYHQLFSKKRTRVTTATAIFAILFNTNIATARQSKHPTARTMLQNKWDSEELSLSYKFPIRILISPVKKGVKNFRSNYPGLIHRGANEWTQATEGAITFTFVSAPPADFLVTFDDVIPHNVSRYGCTQRQIREHSIFKSHIFIAAPPSLTERQVLHICCHEIGHALGLRHSQHDGVMHAPPIWPNPTFMTSADFDDLKRLNNLDSHGKFVMPSQQDMDNYRQTIEGELTRHIDTAKIVEANKLTFSFDLRADGQILSYHVSPSNTDDAKTLLMALTTLPKLPTPPSKHGTLSAKGTIAAHTPLSIEQITFANNWDSITSPKTLR